jgi:hypothetical protein
MSEVMTNAQSEYWYPADDLTVQTALLILEEKGWTLVNRRAFRKFLKSQVKRRPWPEFGLATDDAKDGAIAGFNMALGVVEDYLK